VTTPTTDEVRKDARELQDDELNAVSGGLVPRITNVRATGGLTPPLDAPAVGLVHEGLRA
jgi:hypothetical protein